MALQLPDPAELEQTIKLEKADPSGETWVRVKQATMGENAIISALWAKTSWEFDDAQRGKVKQYNEVSRAQIMGEQVRLTLLESNMLDHQEQVLFPLSHSARAAERGREPFYVAWAKLPSPWAEEIHEAVLQANPQWRTDKEAQDDLGEA